MCVGGRSLLTCVLVEQAHAVRRGPTKHPISADRTTSVAAASPHRSLEPGSSTLLAASDLTPMTASTASGANDRVSHAGARGGNQPMGNERDGGDAIGSCVGGDVGFGSGSAVDASGDGASTAGATRGGAVGCARGGGSGALGCGGGGPGGRRRRRIGRTATTPKGATEQTEMVRY